MGSLLFDASIRCILFVFCAFLVVLHVVGTKETKGKCWIGKGCELHGNLRALGDHKFVEKQVFPATVSIHSKKFLKRIYCLGFILTDKLVATAAHCLDKIKTEELVVSVRTHSVLDGTLVEAKGFLRHPKYDCGLEYDVAVVRVAGDIRLDDMQKPVVLPPQDEPLPKGPGFFIAIGETYPRRWIPLLDPAWLTNEKYSSFKAEMIDQKTCSSVYGPRIGSTMFCAGSMDGNDNPCASDDGTGLYKNEGSLELFGMLLFIDGCGRKNRPGVYLQISKVSDWLKSVMKNPNAINKVDPELPLAKVPSTYENQFQIRIQIEDEFDHKQHPHFSYCMGSIISKHFALTSARCVEALPMARSASGLFNIRVELPEDGFFRKEEVADKYSVEVIDYFIHPNYKEAQIDHNAALLQTANPLFKEKSPMKPIPLANGNEDLKDGAKGFVAYWTGGMKAMEMRPWEETHRHVKTDVTIISNADCEKQYKGWMKDTLFCVTTQIQDSINFRENSGSPLVSNGKQYGILAWSYGFPRSTKCPVVFMKISKIRTWIKEKANV